MRLNSQPSHLRVANRGDGVNGVWKPDLAFTPSPRHAKSKDDGHRARHRVLLARDDDVPVQQVRRPVGLAPRPRDEADGVVLAPAAPFLAEASFGDAGHFAGSPRSSRRCWWFAPRRAGWVLARERCGRCNCACCCSAGYSGRPAFESRQRARAVLGAAMALHFASRAPRRVGVGGFWSAAVDQTSAIRTRLDVFRLLCLELGTDFGGKLPALIRRRPEC